MNVLHNFKWPFTWHIKICSVYVISSKSIICMGPSISRPSVFVWGLEACLSAVFVERWDRTWYLRYLNHVDARIPLIRFYVEGEECSGISFMSRNYSVGQVEVWFFPLGQTRGVLRYDTPAPKPVQKLQREKNPLGKKKCVVTHPTLEISPRPRP